MGGSSRTMSGSGSGIETIRQPTRGPPGLVTVRGMGPSGGPTLTTERLILRRWRDADREPFARLNGDPAVMRHFVQPLTRDESDALVDRIEAGFEECGFGIWAVERRDDGAFLGFTGLTPPTFEAPFTPCVEVGWRFDRFAWGHGYATEAGRESLRFGFEEAGLPEIFSWTSPLNTAVGRGHGAARDAARPGRRLRPPTRARKVTRCAAMSSIGSPRGVATTVRLARRPHPATRPCPRGSA